MVTYKLNKSIITTVLIGSLIISTVQSDLATKKKEEPKDVHTHVQTQLTLNHPLSGSVYLG